MADGRRSDPLHAGHPAFMKNPAGYRPAYEYLHIYYLEGLAGAVDAALGPDFIGNWEEDGFSFLFFSSPARETVRQLLENRSDLKLLDQFDMRYDDWQGGRFQGLRTGRLVIEPAWADKRVLPAVDGLIVRLDPGVVFGAGTHPTTRDCLAAIEALSADASGGTLLDLGTGTGVLAVAAARLGWPRVLAVDFNRLAARTAWHNVKLNALEDRVLAVHGRAEDLVACPAEALVANIHYDVLQPLIRSAGFRRCPRWILSGLLRSQAREVEAYLASAGFAIQRRWSRDNTWFTYLGASETVEKGPSPKL